MILTNIIPSNCPANIKKPVEYDSSIGYVTSTPSSNPTAIIGIIQNPTIKQNSVGSQVCPVKKLADTPIVLNTERAHITITDSLYTFLISTHTPNTADPIIPPTINTAPNTDASS